MVTYSIYTMALSEIEKEKTGKGEEKVLGA